jgi:hypothetical protein
MRIRLAVEVFSFSLSLFLSFSLSLSLFHVMFFHRHKLPNGWNTKVCEIFPELKESALQDVTLLHLAQHRSGIIEDLEKEEEEELYRHISSLSFSEQRRAYVAKIATKPLHHPPGLRLLYFSFSLSLSLSLFFFSFSSLLSHILLPIT